MHWLRILLLAVALGHSGCAEKKSAPEQQAPPVAAAAARSVQLPPPIAAATMLGLTKIEVHKLLGPPAESAGLEESFKTGPVSLTITYGHGKSSRIMANAEGVRTEALHAWLKLDSGPLSVRGSRYAIIPWDIEGMTSSTIVIDLADLPAKSPPIKSLLGGNRRRVKRALKAWEALDGDMFIDREDDLMLQVDFESNRVAMAKKGDVRFVSITFRQGIDAGARRDEILAWLRLQPLGDVVQIKRRRFRVTGDKLSLTFQRLHTNR